MLARLQRLLHRATSAAAPELAVRSPLWRKVSADYLRMFPRCAICGETAGVVPHHILPVHFPGGKELELVTANLITLCLRDHLLFGHLGDWRAMNGDVRLDAAWIRTKIRDRSYPPKEGLPYGQ